MRARSARQVALCLLALPLLRCGGSPASPSAQTPTPTPRVVYRIESITDGDTARFTPPLFGATTVRFVGIDAPETAQSPWGAESRASLLALIPPGTSVTLRTDFVTADAFGRLLAAVVREDGLDVNREQVRLGHAVTYFIWPNVAAFDSYRTAQIEAQQNARGIWSRTNPLRELPFEYRLRIDGDAPGRPVGDSFTKFFIAPRDYALMSIHNRVFFNSDLEARSSEYKPCPVVAGAYSRDCFGPS